MAVNIDKTLTLKQRRFCESYVICGNAAEAVIKDGYRVSKNGKPDRDLAKSIGCENLTKPYLRAYIEQLYKATGMTAAEIKAHHIMVIRQFADLNAKLKAIDMYYKVTGQYASKRNDDNDEISGKVDATNSL